MPSTQTHVSANLGKMSKHVAEVSQLVTSWTVKTTAMNFPPRSLISSLVIKCERLRKNREEPQTIANVLFLPR